MAPRREGWMCFRYTLSSACEAPEWGCGPSEWLDVYTRSSDERGGRDVNRGSSAQRQWMKACDRWGCLESGPTEKTKDPILRKAGAQKPTEGVRPAEEPKNTYTKKCSN